MRNRLKASILFAVVLVIASFVSIGCAKNRVETRQKCYQFKVEQPEVCQKRDMEEGKSNKSISTWLLEWGKGEGPCKAEVFAAYGNEVTCENVKKFDTAKILTDKELKITATYSRESKTLADVLVADEGCSETWMRFIDENGCNYQIIWIGGIPIIIP